MPGTNIDKAIEARWNAAGLNTSIAALYPGDDEAAPENAGSMPRAQYATPDSTVESQSKSSIVFIQPVRFRVWGKTYALAKQYLEYIEAKFLNSDRAGTNPLSLTATAGNVLDIEPQGSTVTKEDDAVFQGISEWYIRWFKVNAIPS